MAYDTRRMNKEIFLVILCSLFVTSCDQFNFNSLPEAANKLGLDLNALNMSFSEETKEMISSSEKQLELNPKDIGSYVILASLYGAHGKHSEAVSYYRKALDIDSENILALQGLGGTYMTMSLFQNNPEYGEKAMSTLMKALVICERQQENCREIMDLIGAYQGAKLRLEMGK